MLEIIGGVYREREDALMPSSRSSGTCARAGRHRAKSSGAASRCWPAKRSANHPQIPAWVQATGLRRALLVSFDGAVTPDLPGSTVVNWSARTASRSTRSPASRSRPTRPRRSSTSSTTLHQAITQDSAPTVAARPQGRAGRPARTRTCSRSSELGPVLGDWTTFCAATSATPWPATTSARQPRTSSSPTTSTSVTNEHRPDPVSAFAAHARARRRLDAAYTLAALHRCLSAAGPTDEESAARRQLKTAEDASRDDAGCDADRRGDVRRLAASRPDEPRGRGSSRTACRSGRPTSQPGLLRAQPVRLHPPRRAGTRRRSAARSRSTARSKAAQFDGDKTRARGRSPAARLRVGSARRAGRHAGPEAAHQAWPTGYTVRNEFFEAEIDPATGGLQGVPRHADARHRGSGSSSCSTPAAR